MSHQLSPGLFTAPASHAEELDLATRERSGCGRALLDCLEVVFTALSVLGLDPDGESRSQDVGAEANALIQAIQDLEILRAPDDRRVLREGNVVDGVGMTVPLGGAEPGKKRGVEKGGGDLADPAPNLDVACLVENDGSGLVSTGNGPLAHAAVERENLSRLENSAVDGARREPDVLGAGRETPDQGGGVGSEDDGEFDVGSGRLTGQCRRYREQSRKNQ